MLFFFEFKWNRTSRKCWIELTLLARSTVYNKVNDCKCSFQFQRRLINVLVKSAFGYVSCTASDRMKLYTKQMPHGFDRSNVLVQWRLLLATVLFQSTLSSKGWKAIQSMTECSSHTKAADCFALCVASINERIGINYGFMTLET